FLKQLPDTSKLTEDFLKDLTEGSTDLVVHSWKDLPTAPKTETMIIATLPRADQRDLLLMKKSAVGSAEVNIFSSSPRREYNLTKCLPELFSWKTSKINFLPVRGNVQTRVKKWKDEPNVHGLVVAKAAMDRLLNATQEEFQETRSFLRSAFRDDNWMVLPLSENPTAAAQGALAVEIKSDRQDLIQLFRKINHTMTFEAVSVEREILQQYGGGCHQKIGISVLPKKYGAVVSLRGLTDQGEKLFRWDLERQKLAPKLAGEDLISFPSEMIKRSAISAAAENLTKVSGKEKALGLWISRAEAWVPNAPDAIIWTAGLQTWRKLAAQGVWVNGTNDGLGEAEDTLTTELVGQNVKWYKLTHQKSDGPSQMEKIITYEIKSEEETPSDLIREILASKRAKMFFWKSTTQFERIKVHFDKVGVKMEDHFHACGPGSTREFLAQQNLSAEKIFVFLNETEWRTKCQM
ncbi:MAG: hydroxymethylbilane synthase, partial [Bdellovibrionota bacterium]